MPKRGIMKSGVWFTLFIFATGLALGYAFAVQGGTVYLARLVGKVASVPTPHVSQPMVTLGLIVLVAIGIIWAARRK